MPVRHPMQPPRAGAAPAERSALAAFAVASGPERRHLTPDDEHVAARRAGELLAALNSQRQEERRQFILSAWDIAGTGGTVEGALQRLAEISAKLGRGLRLVTVELSAPEGTLAHVVDDTGAETAIVLALRQTPPYRLVATGTIRHVDVIAAEDAAPKIVELETPVVTVPLIFKNSRPFVDVTIDDAGPYRFMVETGCDCVVLTPETVAALIGRLEPVGPETLYSVRDLPIGSAYRIEEIRIGGARLRDLTAYVTPKETGVHGVLGLAAFRSLLLTIDYPRQVIELRQGSLPEPDGLDILPVRRHGAFFVVDVRVGRLTLPAVVDTQAASGSGLSLTPEIAGRMRFASLPASIGTAVVGHLYETPVKLGRLGSDVAVGRYTFKQPFVSVLAFPGGLPQLPNLGADVLSQFEVTLDQRNARLRLELPVLPPGVRRSKGGPVVFDMPPSYRALGMETLAERGELKITAVRPAGPADRAGLKEGDVIVRFDGRAAPSLPRTLNAVATNDGPIVVDVTRNGRPVRVSLECETLVR